LILKWYITNDEYLIKNIYVNSAENDANIFSINLFHNVNINKIKKINFFDFKIWFNELRDKDYEYITNLKYYGFRIVFDKKSIFFKKENLIPKYPWNANYKRIWISQETSAEAWLFKQNRKLYYQYKKQKLKKNIKNI